MYFTTLYNLNVVHALIYQAPSSPTFLSNLKFNLKLTCMHLSAKICKLRNFKILDDGGAWYKNTQQYFLKLWKYLRYMYLHLVLSPLVNQAQFTPLGNQCTGLPIQVDHCPAARSRWQTWIHINIIRISLTKYQLYNLPNTWLLRGMGGRGHSLLSYFYLL